MMMNSLNNKPADVVHALAETKKLAEKLKPINKRLGINSRSTSKHTRDRNSSVDFDRWLRSVGC
jgi:hypothetical protein